MSDRKVILNALKSEFEPKGYFVEGGEWTCCQSCGWSEIHHKGFENAIFWHEQDEVASFNYSGYLVNDLYLAWNGDGEAIVECLKAAGLKVEWSGDPNERIMVLATTAGMSIADEDNDRYEDYYDYDDDMDYDYNDIEEGERDHYNSLEDDE